MKLLDNSVRDPAESPYSVADPENLPPWGKHGYKEKIQEVSCPYPY